MGGVPATGYFGAGWSIGTLLVLYWLETILITLVVAVLFLRHRRATRTADPWGVQPALGTGRGRSAAGGSRGSSFLRDFLSVMVPFTAAHGLFVALFAFFVFPQEVGPEAGVSPAALADGLVAIAIFVVAGLVIDLAGIGHRPFRWIERMGERAKGRMIATHLTIIFGAAALGAFEASTAFLAVFVAFKSLVDLGGMLPDREPEESAPRAVTRSGR